MKRKNFSTQVRNSVHHLRIAVLTVLAALNVVLVLVMLTSACGVWISAETYPRLACVGYPFSVLQIANALCLVLWLIFYWRLAAIPLAGFLLCFGVARLNFPVNWSSAPPENALKVLTYNVMGFDTYENPPTRQDVGPIVRYILSSDADIVCLQEAYLDCSIDTASFHDIFRKTYPYQRWDAVGVKDSCGFVALLSKYPILSSEPIVYRSSSNGSIASRLLIDGDTVLVVNNHLESNKFTVEEKDAYKDMIVSHDREHFSHGYSLLYSKFTQASAIRAPQADSVHAYVERSPERLKIVCGDFNTPPVSYIHHVVAKGLTDAFESAGTGFGISYNRRGFYFRIDNIFVSKSFDVCECKVDDSTDASDHYPMYAYIVKK